MTRVAIAIASMWIALAQQPAAAHARNASAPEALAPAMCSDASQPFVLASTSALDGVQPQAAHAQPSENDEQPAWCVTPNDPRCSPRDTSTPIHGQLLLVPLCDFEVVKLPQLRSIDLASTPASTELGALRPAIRGRLERPPRTHAG
jgi:hypothetical protein